VDGLDSFTLISETAVLRPMKVWIVVREIAGTPKADIDCMVENCRKNADKD
jgi:hypothetical protein